MARKPMNPGKEFTKKIERGPNKGDTVGFRVARGGKPYPTRLVKDVGSRSTIADDVPRGRKRSR